MVRLGGAQSVSRLSPTGVITADFAGSVSSEWITIAHG